MLGNNSEKVDILNRDVFIFRCVEIVDLISSNRGNMTFAINGKWGCGKTFVLDDIKRRLSEDKFKNYLVITYNCWQYDYYDEPLVAIVSALIDSVEKTKKLSADTKIALKHAAYDIGAYLFTQVIKNKVGLDLGETASKIKETKDSTIDEINNKRDYDRYYGFKKALTGLKEELKKLAEEYTIILAVDEVDRCLPEYAIKVLERLHHVAEDVPNMITIIAVDKERLDNTINSIFGANSASTYLKKLIRFELSLDNGRQNSYKFFDKYPEFYARFDASLYGELNNTELFLEELFRGIDIRTQEQIVEKAAIFNDICFGDKKQDHSMMYMELFLAMLHYHCQDDSIFSSTKVCSDRKNLFSHYTRIPAAFKTESSGFVFKRAELLTGDPMSTGIIVDPSNVFMVIFYYWFNVPSPQSVEGMGHRFIPFIKKTNVVLSDNVDKLRISIDSLKIIS